MDAKTFRREVLRALDKLTPEDIERIHKEIGEDDYEKPSWLKDYDVTNDFGNSIEER